MSVMPTPTVAPDPSPTENYPGRVRSWGGHDGPPSPTSPARASRVLRYLSCRARHWMGEVVSLLFFMGRPMGRGRLFLDKPIKVAHRSKG